MTTSCASCSHYDHHLNSGKESQEEGLCRFNPPISQPGPDAHGLWPVVSKSDWCAHFSVASASQHSVA